MDARESSVPLETAAVTVGSGTIGWVLFAQFHAKQPSAGTFQRAISSHVNDYFTWNPDGRRIMFSLNEGRGMRLMTVNRDTDDGPQPVAGVPAGGIPAGGQTFDCDWPPDRNSIVFSALALSFAGGMASGERSQRQRMMAVVLFIPWNWATGLTIPCWRIALSGHSV